jgi:hypothetical protein
MKGSKRKMNPTQIRGKQYSGMSREDARQRVPKRIRIECPSLEMMVFLTLEFLKSPNVSNNSVVSNIPGRTVP